MPALLVRYVRIVDRLNLWIGRVVMYSLFVMVGILLWSSASKTFFTPSLWTLESAQFALAAYYMLGGAYAMQQGGHVRMDLFYSDWSPRTKALIDSVTVLFLIFFLVVLLLGGINSTAYSLQYSERSATAWRPLMWPIKTIMCTGIVLMLLQALAELLKDVARVRGREI